jgi:carboxyl-terminal processing protease
LILRFTVVAGLLLSSVGLTGVDAKSSVRPPATAERPVPGIWRSRGYGYLLDIRPSQVRVFDIAAERCTPTDTVGDTASLGRIENITRKEFVLAGETSRIGFERIASLPRACSKESAGSSNPLVNFDALWTIFDQNYPFFSKRRVDWNQIRRIYRPRVVALGSGGDPWPIFTEMLAPLHDPHVHLLDGTRRFQARRGESEPIDVSQEGLLKYLRTVDGPMGGRVTTLAYDRLIYGTTSNAVGYLAVMTMGGFAAGPKGWPGNTTPAADMRAAEMALTEALLQLKDTRGLILDLRFNPGGAEAFANLIAGCFADRRRLAYTKSAKDGSRHGPNFSVYTEAGACRHYDRPVVVLVGERTTSAAEALVMRLRVLPAVTVLGQPTQGAHSDVLDKTLPNGWRVGLSNEVYRLADGRVYEGVGIPPNIATRPTTPSDPPSVRFGRDIAAAEGVILARADPQG